MIRWNLWFKFQKKKTLKRNSDKRKYKKNSLIKYINQHSKFDNIDKNVINRYSLDDLLSTKDSINNKELYLDILNMKKRTVRNASNINKIEKVITELKSELLDTSWVWDLFIISKSLKTVAISL